MSSDLPSPAASPSGRLTVAARRACERDWVFFVIEELNGLGDVLRFQRDEGGSSAAAAHASARVTAILEALTWQAEEALGHTWAFVRGRVRFPEDLWGPNLVLDRLETDRPKLARWREGLAPEARAMLWSPLGENHE